MLASKVKTGIFLMGIFLAGVSSSRAEGLTAVRVASGLSRPVYVTAPRGDTRRLFIVEQHTGKIKILNLITGQINAQDFLDLSGLATGNEQGLLGLAFDPDYKSNGFFYVNLTDSTGTTRIRRYQVSADPDVATSSATLILSIAQPQSNHNGGWIGFGPNDGYLYIASGDGGGGNDDDGGHTSGQGNGQDTTNNLLGKILRIDVHGDDFPLDSLRNYAVPPTNPFVGQTGDDEIWAFGLRNPWRCSFDRLTGDLYIGDVGQNDWEEVDYQPANSSGGENYGWRVMEGNHCNFANDPLGCFDSSFIPPIHEYEHTQQNPWASITGGYVYRGPRQSLQGVYFLADYIWNQIWSFRWDGASMSEFTERTAELEPNVGSIQDIASFGEDARGNLYIVELGGDIFRLIPEPVVPGDLDGDGVVNLIDYSLFAALWDEVGCGWCGGADWDGDQDVDSNDLRIMLENWLTNANPD